MTLTDALREQAIEMLMLDLKRAEERAETEGWIDADLVKGRMEWKNDMEKF